MKGISQQLLELLADASDRRVAMLLTEQCLQLTDAPYRFSINHDIRPPANKPCPLEYTWTRKDRCGFESRSKLIMRKWLTSAFLHGYTVYYISGMRASPLRDRPYSILIARRSAELYQKIRDNPDDDIPF